MTAAWKWWLNDVMQLVNILVLRTIVPCNWLEITIQWSNLFLIVAHPKFIIAGDIFSGHWIFCYYAF